ncbi:MAG: PadR family transcriptional regulator [Acidimicrobiia bacterium]
MGSVPRGAIRTGLLAFLLERPGHGYEAMQYLEDKANGTWRPSAGSIYPALQQLEDEGLVRSKERDGRRIFELTAAGRRQAKARIEERGLPWEQMVEEAPVIAEIRRAVFGLESAVTEVLKLGGPEAVAEAVEIVKATRKRLYGLLADD